MLHITARKESDGRITSGRLTTQGKVEAAYGRWEARLKVPGVLGTWPAFWTLGNDIGEVSWPACGEIDIMENFQRPSPDRSGEGIYSTAHSAKHSWGTGTALPGGTSKALDLNLFHTVRMDWSPDKLEFFVNGERTWHLDRNPGSTNLEGRGENNDLSYPKQSSTLDGKDTVHGSECSLCELRPAPGSQLALPRAQTMFIESISQLASCSERHQDTCEVNVSSWLVSTWYVVSVGEAPGHHAIALVTLTLHEDLDLHLTPLLIGHLVLVLVLVLVLHLLVPLSEYRVPGVLPE